MKSQPREKEQNTRRETMPLILNQEALDEVIVKELSSSFDAFAEQYAANASAQDMAVLYAIMNTPCKSTIEVLNDILTSEEPTASATLLRGNMTNNEQGLWQQVCASFAAAGHPDPKSGADNALEFYRKTSAPTEVAEERRTTEQ
jgi:hypothetical protein